VPVVSVDVAMVATALPFNVPVPSAVVPSRKVTVPVGVPEVVDAIVAVNVTGVPLDAEAAELTNASVVAVFAMVSVSAAEVLAARVALPEYLAVIECVPTVSVDVVKVATAPPFSVPLPSGVVPSRKVTVPVGVPEVLDVIVAVNVTAAPLDAETAELTNKVVVAVGAAAVMVSVSAAEVLAAKVELPEYWAVIECMPTASVDVVKVATAPPFSVPLPSVVVPSRKVTVPVGVPELLDEIVAANVTGAPLDAEAAELTSAAVVAIGAAAVMVSVSAAEVLLAKVALPEYLAVIACVPTESVDVVKVATAPLFSVPLPSAVVPSKKVTVPVGVPEAPGVIIAVNVTGVP